MVLETMVVVLRNGGVPFLEAVEKKRGAVVASLLEVKDDYKVVAEESKGSNHGSEQRPFQFEEK